MHSGVGRSYTVKVGQVGASVVLYPSGRCQIDVWTLDAPGNIHGFVVPRKNAAAQLQEWREKGHEIKILRVPFND